MRWVVGDIQGCAREFDDLLSKIRFDPSRDRLWCVGDLVNRGPDSLAVLRLWRDVAGRALLGNHDIYALLAASGRARRKTDTLAELFAAVDGEALLDLLRRSPILVRLDGGSETSDAWIVHAGLDPRWDDLDAVATRINDGLHDDDWLKSADVAFATRVRCCTPQGERSKYTGPPESRPDGVEPWDVLYTGRTLVVHGHWARRGFYRGERTMGLDSGCVYGGKLTAWCHEEDRVVQVPARPS